MSKLIAAIINSRSNKVWFVVVAGLLALVSAVILIRPVEADIKLSHTAGEVKIGQNLTFDFSWFDPNAGDRVKAHVCMFPNSDSPAFDEFVVNKVPGGSCSPELVGSTEYATDSTKDIHLEHILTAEDAAKIGCDDDHPEWCRFTALFLLCDQTGACSLQRVNQNTYGAVGYTIVGNRLPVPQNISLTVNEDSSNNSVALEATDPDPEDADNLTFSLSSGPSHGTVTNDSDGDRFFSYTPTPGYSGPDSFTYSVNDGNHATGATATVSITVVGINDAPILITACVNRGAGPCALLNKPAVDINQALNFEIHWSDEEKDAVTLYVCRTNNYLPAPGFGCEAGQTIASKTTPTASPNADNSATLTTTANVADSGTDVTYYVFACDASVCSSKSNNQGSYHVNASHVLTTETVLASGASGKITSAPAGIDCGADCSEVYPDTATVVLTATPTGTAQFDRWEGACTGSATTCSVTMAADRNVKAYFKPTYALTLTASSGGTIIGPGGWSCRATTCTQRFVAGTSLAISVTADSGFGFDKWSAGTGALTPCNTAPASATVPCSATLTADSNLTANFVPAVTFTLMKVSHPSCCDLAPTPATITYVDLTNTTKTQSCTGSWVNCVVSNIKSGTTLDITSTPTDLSATPVPDMTIHWQSGCSPTPVDSSSPSTPATCRVNSVTAGGQVKVEYYYPPLTLTVTKNPPNGSISTGLTGSGGASGSLDSCLDTGSCTTIKPGETITLNSNPDTAGGFSFGSWTATGGMIGCNNSTADPCVTSMGSNGTIRANYIQAVTFSLLKDADPSADLSSASATLSYTKTDGTAGTTTCAAGWTSCTAIIKDKTLVTISSAPLANMNISWVSGCDSGTARNYPTNNPATCSVALPTTGSSVHVKYFYTPLVLKATSNPAVGGNITGNGSVYGSFDSSGCLFSPAGCLVKPGETITLTGTAAPTYSLRPTGPWTTVGDLTSFNTCNTPTCASAITADATVTANFVKAVKLTINKNSGACCDLPTRDVVVSYTDYLGVARTQTCPAGVTTSPICVVSNIDGTGTRPATITSTAENNMRIDWGTGCSSSSNGANPAAAPVTTTATCTINNIAADAVVGVRYYYPGYTLTITKNPTSAATVTGTINGVASPCIGTGTCNDVRAGATIVLNQTPSAGYVLRDWSLVSGWIVSGCGTTSTSCTFTMPANFAPVTINYNANLILTKNNVTNGPPTVSVPAAGSVAAFICGSAGRPFPCTQAYPIGTALTLTAAPTTGGNRFNSWTTDCSGTSATCSLTLATPKNVKARFTETITQTTALTDISGFNYTGSTFNNTTTTGSGNSASVVMSGIGSWSTTQLDAGNSDFPSLAIGTDSFARVTHHNGGHLVFIRCSNTSCSSRVEHNIDGTNEIGKYNQLSLNSSNLAIVNNVGLNHDRLKVNYCTDLDCTTLASGGTVVEGSGVGLYGFNALGSDGFARIVYYDNQTLNLKFVRCQNFECSSHTAPRVLTGTGTFNPALSKEDQVHQLSLAMGSDNFARIVYYDSTNDDLKYIRCTNADCTTIAGGAPRTLDSGGNVGLYAAIALGTDGLARIAYQDASNGNVKFIRCGDADCTSPTSRVVESNSYTSGKNISIALASDNTARISHIAGNGPVQLEFIRCLDDNCSSHSSGTIGQASPNSRGTRLRLTSSGNAMIAYINSGEHIALAYQTSINTGSYRSAAIAVPTDLTLLSANISWSGNLNGQTLALRSRTCGDSACSNASGDSPINSSGTSVTSVGYIQYEADFSTNNISVSPTLDDLTISFVPQ